VGLVALAVRRGHRDSPLLSVRVTGSEAATASEARDTAKLESQLPEQRHSARGREVLEFKLNLKFEGNLKSSSTAPWSIRVVAT
jgi:hypothetical protein